MLLVLLAKALLVKALLVLVLLALVLLVLVLFVLVLLVLALLALALLVPLLNLVVPATWPDASTPARSATECNEDRARTTMCR